MAELAAAVGGLERFQHEGGAVHAVGEFFRWRELRIDRPNERHAVRADQVEAGHRFAEGGVVAGECGDVGVGGLDGVGAVGFQRVIENPLHRAGVGGGGDGQADDGDEFQVFSFKFQAGCLTT